MKNIFKTLFDKIWDAHIVTSIADGPDVLYIDMHLIHEVTSPQAFTNLAKRGIQVRRPERTIATADHNVPTKNQHLPIQEELSRLQVEKLTENCRYHNIALYGLGHPFQGIVHVIAPELGITQPGMTLVCGDSHTSTHGALGVIAFGIGTSEVEQVLATQCILQNKPKKMRINIQGELHRGVLSKDVILYLISRISSSGATGYFVEYAGSTIRNLSMEARMTICNMSIEMGARGGLIAPDANTVDYVKGKRFAPRGINFEKTLTYWKTLYSDKEAIFDKEHTFQAEEITPMITYGTNPGMGMAIHESIPTYENLSIDSDKQSFFKSLKYMDLKPRELLLGKKIDYIFIGSCTNSRIEDLRLIAQFVSNKQIASHITAFIVPGSKQVEEQAKKEDLDKIFKSAGFEFREPGCSACLGMNGDKIPKEKYCISTSNRNFEGRQGPGARTFLASPLTAAVSAITGKISDIREFI